MGTDLTEEHDRTSFTKIAHGHEDGNHYSRTCNANACGNQNSNLAGRWEKKIGKSGTPFVTAILVCGRTICSDGLLSGCAVYHE